MLIILLVRVVLGLLIAVYVLLRGLIALFFQLFLELLTYCLIFCLGFLDVWSAVPFLELLDYLLFFTMNFFFNLLPSLLLFFEILCRYILCWLFHLLCFISLFLFLLLFFIFSYFIVCFDFFRRLYSCIFNDLFTPLLIIVSFSWNVTALNIHIRMNRRVITDQILL